jgi:hypothetical protein
MLRTQRISLFLEDVASGKPLAMPSSKITAKVLSDAKTPIDRKQLVYFNPAAFASIVDQNLWSRDQQQRLAIANAEIVFDKRTIIVKSAWKIVNKFLSDHICREIGGVKYCLAGLHISSKVLPNWFWATFEHVSNTDRCGVIDCRDKFGARPDHGPNTNLTHEVLALFHKHKLLDVWKNYRLTGTQIDFIDSTGRPVLLGNSFLEKDIIASSSCITCHARSAISPDGSELPIGSCPTQPKCSAPQSFNGPPQPSWFYDQNGKTIFLQRDFVWSLETANSESPSGRLNSPP